MANKSIEIFKNKAIKTFGGRRKVWKRYVDDTVLILSKNAARNYIMRLDNINEPIYLIVGNES